MKNIILLLILALFTNIINAQEKKEYYDNGQLKSIENYVDTIEHGSFIYYFENGTISVEGTMKNGELEGAYSEYNKKGQLKEFTTYKNGYKVGPFKTFWEAGELKEEGTYRSVYFFDGEYDETIRTGVYKAYLPNGDIAISVKLGVNEDNEEIGIGKGIENDYYATDDPYKFILAEESSLLDGEYHGVSKKYYENGQLKEIGEFNKGEEVGIHKEYYDNGQLKSNITFVDGKKIGLYEEYLENGSPSKKGNNGKKVSGFGPYYGEIGNWTYWEYYSNGQLEKKYTKEQNGDYTGNYEGYYENGQLWLKGKFVDDEKEGEWYQFEDGEKYKFFYENGELVKSKKVNSINDPIEDQFYKLKFKNKCYKKVQVAIMFKNLDDEWETKGFFNIEPNEEVYVAKTENRIYYFSAITFDGKIKWEGGFKGTVHGNQESFKEKTIPSYKKHGEHYTYLNCNN